MPSSTFNSDNAYQTTDPRNRLRVALYTLAAGIFLFGGVVLIYNGMLALLYSAGGNINGRVVDQIEHLPEIVEENRDKQKVFVFGSSMVQAGFEPTVFDSAMAARGVDSISYNYGIGNLNPTFQELITRRIQEQFLKGRGRLALALVEFTPFQATIVRNKFGAITADQNIALLSSRAELWEITRHDPTRGIRLINIRYLRDSVSAELITSIPALLTSSIENNARNVAYRAALVRTDELEAEFDELRGSDEPIQGSDRWNVALRGGRIDKSGYSREVLDAMGAWVASRRHPEFMKADLQRRIESADILELGFDDRQIDKFIELVRNFLPIADHVEVIIMPRNSDWVTYTPEVQDRLDGVLRRIAQETGVYVRDFQNDPRITAEHYIDTTHLSFHDGIDAFSRILAEEYADVVKGH
ncbi:MAG: hypothetical protein O6766_02130 [Gammaproteobacteria bacterium]|nr:hypothetical protein [Gammaproteobacteria bacterium]